MLSDPDELRAFFKGLRRILASLGHSIDAPEPTDARRDTPRALGAGQDDDRDRAQQGHSIVHLST